MSQRKLEKKTKDIYRKSKTGRRRVGQRERKKKEGTSKTVKK